MEQKSSISILLVTANVGSIFEDPTKLLHLWIQKFLDHVLLRRPAFIALHLQEVGGKTYEKSMGYVQEFVQELCESDELREYKRIRVYLDEDYNSAENFTALGNLYFVQNTVEHVLMWNFVTHKWGMLDGKSIYSGKIDAVPTKEKAKFPQQFFPESKWSRKGFLRTRWFLNGTIFDLVNIHLFHDASNFTACEKYPSVYCKSRNRALVHILERFRKDRANLPVPYFLFGDFNFRCDTMSVIKKLTQDLTMHRIRNASSNITRVQYRDADGVNILTVGEKEFSYYDQCTFKGTWLRQFDCELDCLRNVLYEYPITFPPSYPYEENAELPDSYMTTRCPAWCDRILISGAARKLIYDQLSRGDNDESAKAYSAPSSYGIIGENVCMGDHKPVYLSLTIKTRQANKKTSKLNVIGSEMTAEELLELFQENAVSKTRNHDQQQQQKIDTSVEKMLHSRYVQLLPGSPDSDYDVYINDHLSDLGSVNDKNCFRDPSSSGHIFRETTV